MYTYVALTLFDYFHILSDCNPVRIHGMQINEMKWNETVCHTVEHLSDKFSDGQKENSHCVPTEKKLDNTGT